MTRNQQNALRFAGRLREFATRKYPGLAAQVSADFAAEAITSIVLRTPVDTGHARHNWHVGFFGARVAEIPGVDPGGFATVAREKAKLANVRPFQNVHISNAVPYAIPLEHGHSRQAPSGMVALTIAELRARAKQIGARAFTVWKSRAGA